MTSVAYSWRNHWVAISIPDAVRQFGCQSKPERFNASNLGPVARGVNRLARALIPPLRRMNVASGSELDLYSIAYRSTRDHFDRVRLPTLLGFGGATKDRSESSVVVGSADVR